MSEVASLKRQIRRLERSRDNWKLRAACKQLEIRAWRVKSRDLSRSRDLWKLRALSAPAASPSDAPVLLPLPSAGPSPSDAPVPISDPSPSDDLAPLDPLSSPIPDDADILPFPIAPESRPLGES